MPNFRRYYVPDALIFITTVVDARRPIFSNSSNVTLLFETMRTVQELHPFHLLAYVIMPEHLHFLMHSGTSANFSVIMQSIKRNVTWNYKKLHAIADQTVLWQGRFWDHVIRDDRDLARHMDYIHFNPVKHGCVAAPLAWEHSTYRYWMERGYYDPTWGMQTPTSICDMDFE